jgi:hypothetical protein
MEDPADGIDLAHPPTKRHAHNPSRPRVFKSIRLLWWRSKALSVLQNAYDMPLKFPLNPLDDVTLRQVTSAAVDTAGNEYDAAAAFMTLRIKAELQTELAIGKAPGLVDVAIELPRLGVGISRTASLMRYFRLHMDTLSDINKLNQQVILNRQKSN